MFHSLSIPEFFEELLQSNQQPDEDSKVSPEMMARIASYPVIRKKKKNKACMVYQDTGKAPVTMLNDGRTMPTFGLGTWHSLRKDKKSHVKKEIKSEVVRAVEGAIEAGYRHFDTAPLYGTEDQVGEGINNMIRKGVIERSDVFITTKLGNKQHAPDSVIPALRESLKRLQIDYVDLYLIEWPVGLKDDGSFDNTDYLDTWKAMIEAKDRGLARSIGLSNFNQAMLDRVMACTSVRPAVLQVEINLNIQQPTLLSYCKSQGVAVTAYTPLGSLSPPRARRGSPPPRWDDPALVQIARRYHKTVPQIVLQYLVELGTIPIPKSTNYNHINQNIDIFDFSLSQQERALLASYDVGYRTSPVLGWLDSPLYPFERHKEEEQPEEQIVYIQRKRKDVSCRNSVVSRYLYKGEEDSD